MKARGWKHDYTLNGFYCALCGEAYLSDVPCEPDKIPDYEAGRH